MHGTDDKNQHRQARSWRAHNAGDTALVVARRPEIYASGHAHRLFIDGRAHLVSVYLYPSKYRNAKSNKSF